MSKKHTVTIDNTVEYEVPESWMEPLRAYLDLVQSKTLLGINTPSEPIKLERCGFVSAEDAVACHELPSWWIQFGTAPDDYTVACGKHVAVLFRLYVTERVPPREGSVHPFGRQ